MNVMNLAISKPLKINQLQLKNRVVMAPMTRSMSPGGVITEDVSKYYTRRAEAKVGLIITEGAVINRELAAPNSAIPHFYGNNALDAWKKLADRIHLAQGKIIPQIWHVGSMRELSNGGLKGYESPSGLTGVGSGDTGHGLDIKSIEKIITEFGNAAYEAWRLGFDGIELHGAHGYLIDQFIWEKTNRRKDKYGGNPSSRLQFAIDIVKECKSRTSSNFPVIFRFSQWKVQDFNARLFDNPKQLEQFLVPLLTAGVDIFHCSTRRFWETEFGDKDLNLAGWTRKITGVPVITVGSIGLNNEFLASLLEGKNAKKTNLDLIERMVERGDVDLVAIGRSLLADPKWYEKVNDGNYSDINDFSANSLNDLF